MKLPPPIAAALEASLNRYLVLDPDAVSRAGRLRGKVVQLQVVGLDISVFFLFLEDRINLLEDFDGDVDVVISGAPLSLISVARGTRGIHDGDVVLAGDIEIAQQFGRLFASLDVDWEEHLSKIAGDTVAHQIGRMARSGSLWAARTRNKLRSNTADYLRDESDHLPHDWELEEYSCAVDDLRDRVDRLVKRVRRLDPKDGKT